jgi:hypothetical protein
MKIDLRSKFNRVECQMMEKLEEIRATFHHKGIKGGEVEACVREFLQRYLPRRFQVGEGEIIDTAGQRSAQTDVVIADEHHPFTFTEHESGLFFVEGVTAAGEVKSVLTSTDFDRSIDNSKVFKSLSLSPRYSYSSYACDADVRRFFTKPPWFLLAFESQLSLTTINQKLRKRATVENEVNQMVDAVFVLGQGWVINFGDGITQI